MDKTNEIIKWLGVNQFLELAQTQPPALEFSLLLDYLVEYAGNVQMAQNRVYDLCTEQAAHSYNAHVIGLRKIKRRIEYLHKQAQATALNLVATQAARCEPASPVVQPALQTQTETPGPVSETPGKEYDLGFGHMGNGLTVWNRREERDGEYVTLAHIGPNRVVTYYDNELPDAVREQIEHEARTSNMTISATQAAPVFNTSATSATRETDQFLDGIDGIKLFAEPTKPPLTDRQPGIEDWSELATPENTPDTPGVASDDVDPRLPEQEASAAQLTELERKSMEIAQRHTKLPMQDRMNIIAETFGCKTARIKTTPCTGKWRGTSDMFLVFDNDRSLFMGNRLTPKAKTKTVQNEFVNCTLVEYNPEIMKERLELASAALAKREAKDNAVAAEKGLKPYTFLNAELNDGTADCNYMGWYYATLAVGGKIIAFVETGLNYDISRGSVSEDISAKDYFPAGALKETDVDFVFNNVGFASDKNLYQLHLSDAARERAEKTLAEKLAADIPEVRARPE